MWEYQDRQVSGSYGAWYNRKEKQPRCLSHENARQNVSAEVQNPPINVEYIRGDTST